VIGFGAQDTETLESRVDHYRLSDLGSRSIIGVARLIRRDNDCAHSGDDQRIARHITGPDRTLNVTGLPVARPLRREVWGTPYVTGEAMGANVIACGNCPFPVRATEGD